MNIAPRAASLAVCAFSVISCLAQANSNPSDQSQQAAKPAAGGGPSPTTKQQLYQENDSISMSWKPNPIVCAGACATLGDDGIQGFAPQLQKLDFDAILQYVPGSPFSWPTDATGCKNFANTAFVLHIALWKSSAANGATKAKITGLAYSNWRGYRSVWNGHGCTLHQPRAGDNSPLFYKTKNLRLIAIDLFQYAIGADDANLVYKTSTTPSVKQNIQDLGTLIEAVTGAAPGAAREAVHLPDRLNGFVTDATFSATSAPPYILTVTESAGVADPKGNNSTKSATNSPTDAVDCSDASSKGCSFSRTFSVLDPEYWDVAVGIVMPGTTEAVYAAGTGGAAPKSTLKHHTDAYAFVDLYPFASIAPKESYWPHFNLGVPLTSQSLHRPYVGAAENVSLWGQRKGFPLSICVFGGIVDMKQQIFSASSPGDLKWDRAIKPVFGLEFPISQMASKLAGKSKSQTKTSTGSSGGGSS